MERAGKVSNVSFDEVPVYEKKKKTKSIIAF